MTLYLKYRPKDFDSLVWQTFIKTTLKQAVLDDKLVWSYLFCWPRWTGKTSTARIFAKTINCQNLQNWNPCWECSVCVWFQNNSLSDIIEIDAASNTWVDNVREIIERASFMPNICKYKVYIIDEVHMLSKWAFNALLKILEEPPAHLKFILATTEIHKIPETILSRCQRYDFKSITDVDLKKLLKYIAESEWVSIDEKSLDFIIKQANGWLRNAISLFEQLIVWNEIKYELVLENYWIPASDKISNFLTKIINKDQNIIQEFETISRDYNVVLFYKELLFFIKDEILKNLENKDKLNILIKIFSTLEESFLKSKTSFDINTTLLLWIVKAISWYEKEVVNTQINTQKSIPTQSVSTPKVQTNIAPKIEVPDVSFDDINDIFGWEDDLNSVFPMDDCVVPQTIVKPVSEAPKPQVTHNTNSWNFNKDNFINTLKNNKAPWALTMSLRWSDFSFEGTSLTVFTKTKISLKTISSTDNIALMSQAFENMWFWEIQIILK